MKTQEDNAITSDSIKERLAKREISTHQAIQELARMFPGIRHLPYVREGDEWDAVGFSKLTKLSTGETYARNFILNVWCPNEWRIRKETQFHITMVDNWPYEERWAFIQWAANPWWP